MVYPKTGSESAGDQALPSPPSFPELETAVLAYWERDDTFRASVEQRPPGTDGDNEFVFYDGPPFANGLPHYGHLLTGYVKDLVPRYQTMRGRRVERRFGWDTHGLPAELEAQRVLGLKTKDDIVALGIEKFNATCREQVLKYTREWRDYVTRQARWVDFDHDYKTLDPSYMESVIWAFKSLYDKGLVYEGKRVLPYCWNDETPLSNHELRMDDDVYQQRQDPASTVWLELETGERAMAWTTMPWTLIPNTNLVVGLDIDYAVMLHADGHRYLLAESRLPAYANELGDAERVGTIRGSELVGRKYTPMFDFLVDQLADVPAAFTVLAGDFVSTEEGTGLVQVAPAHGEDDFNVCTAAGVPVILTVDAGARFTSVAGRFQGLQVFDANKPLLAELRERGVLVRQDNYLHPYPHCWRCRRPLIYLAVSSWFVSVTTFKQRMLELNEQIEWVPEHIKHGQFGKWLANARDWSISRNRFWGSPIPVWQSDDPAYPRTDVYGSFAELERDFGRTVTDLHRPYVDELTRPNPDDPTGRSTMRRVTDVLDVWFDSGSMSFAQVHYPFENAEWFEHHFPADFIVEYTPQTRGWFYTLHVLATALFDRPAFLNCVCHGILLGDDGQKMSKSLRNYPDSYAMFDTHGADAMRWFLMSSPILRGGNLVLTEHGIRDSARQVLLPLWNAWYFFALYANADGYDAQRRTDSADVLDRYVLAKLRDLVEQTTAQLDAYDISGACAQVRGFLDALNNWYIRRSRDRFWAGDHAAFDTLWTVLDTLTRVAAPLLPMLTEEIYRGLTGARSVHLTDWPAVDDLPADDSLAAAMDSVRSVCSTALSVRKAAGLRVRLPLASLTVATPGALVLQPFRDLIADEVNVKEVRLVSDVDSHSRLELQVVPRALGPRLGKQVQQVITAVKAGDWSATDGAVTAGGVPLADGEFALTRVAVDERGAAPLPGGDGLVILDTVVTPELAAEGVARDVVRAVQQARRDAALDVSDRISLTVDGPAAVADAVAAHRAFVCAETLATELTFGAAPAGTPESTVGDGAPVRVAVVKAGRARA